MSIWFQTALLLCCATLQMVSAEEKPADPSRLAVSSLLLDGSQYKNKMIAVGDRGHVLYSNDDGLNWTQAAVPTRVMITGVFILDAQHAWAVGHDATILKSTNGGKNWQLSFSAPEKESPLLDIWFMNQNHGFAVGGYGLFLETRDGGAHWQQRWINEEDDFHLNHITAIQRLSESQNTLFIAAESGIIYRSTDGGHSWDKLHPPYQGSFFGTLSITPDVLYAFGLRGHLFISRDNGNHWDEINSGTTAMLTSGLKSKTGECIFSGLSGVLLIDERCNGESLKLTQLPGRSGISTLLSDDENNLILIGEAGITRVPHQ